jgi:hypothetical protein
MSDRGDERGKVGVVLFLIYSIFGQRRGPIKPLNYDIADGIRHF